MPKTKEVITQCDHAYEDQKHCVKCGFTPQPDEHTISLLAKSLYEARTEATRLKTNETTLKERLEIALAQLGTRQDSEEERGRARGLIDKLREMRDILNGYVLDHNRKGYAVTCKCELCAMARKVLR